MWRRHLTRVSARSPRSSYRVMVQYVAVVVVRDVHPIGPRNPSLSSDNHPITGAAMRFSFHHARRLIFPGSLLAVLACGGGDLTLPGQVGPPSDLLQVSGNSQSAQAGNEVPAPLVVRLVDEQGNAVRGSAVSWVVGDGGGTVSPVTVPTDTAGLASTRLTLGPSPGTNTVNAVVSGIGIVTFTASATGGGGGGAGGGGGGKDGNGNGSGHGHGGEGGD
jgi:hypothetical protein